MADSEKRQPTDDGHGDDLDHPDQISNGQDPSNALSRVAETSTTPDQSVTRRLRDIFTGDGDVDLLMQNSDREDGFLQWLRALDMQVMGACRADERLKPLLKFNVSAALEDDGLLTHLSQHFEPPEVCMLARCLCIPLVSVRVGKISQRGTVLSPTASRGNLCLTLLPNSVMRISFNGDDGSVEKISSNSMSECSDIEIKEISADSSGRSFFIRTPESTFYYWCSEKSKLLGDELLRKMKDLLIQKPSLAELTGINESRINCFGTQIRAYLAGLVTISTDAVTVNSTTPLNDSSSSLFDRQMSQSSFQCQKSLRLRQSGSQGCKANLSSSLSPRPSSFKDNAQKSLSTGRSLGREKSRQRCVSLAGFSDLATSYSTDSTCLQKDKLPETSGPNACSAAFIGFDILSQGTEFPFSSPESRAPLFGSLPVSPHYCWCPPVASALQQFTVGHPLSSSEPLTIPPLCSLPSTLFASKPLLSFAEVQPLDFPSIMPEPPLLKLPGSQQVPTFTPLMSDPIVHIPMIDFCSSGQGYLVSAGPGPALSSSLPPLSASLVDPLPKAESVIEKGARETLSMLLSSSSSSSLPKPQLFEILPCVLTSGGCDMPSVFAAGSSSSRGLFCGTRDVDAITSSVGLVLLSKKPCGSEDDLAEQQAETPSSDPDRQMDY